MTGPVEPGGSSRAVRMLVAMLIVGVWIAALCTAPQILGGYLWKWLLSIHKW